MGFNLISNLDFSENICLIWFFPHTHLLFLFLPNEINSFDGAFFTGTAAEVTAIEEISGVEFDVKLIDEIKEKYFEIVSGKNKDYEDFLTYCDWFISQIFKYKLVFYKLWQILKK